MQRSLSTLSEHIPSARPMMQPLRTGKNDDVLAQSRRAAEMFSSHRVHREDRGEETVLTTIPNANCTRRTSGQAALSHKDDVLAQSRGAAETFSSHRVHREHRGLLPTTPNSPQGNNKLLADKCMCPGNRIISAAAVLSVAKTRVAQRPNNGIFVSLCLCGKSKSNVAPSRLRGQPSSSAISAALRATPPQRPLNISESSVPSVAKTPIAQRPGSRPGFTLIELLTVMTILIIAGAIAVPSLIDAFQTNSLTQAANVVSAYIAEGHNLALKTHQQVAVVFYEETAAGISASGLPTTVYPHGGETAVALAIAPAGQPENGTSSVPLYFEPYIAQPVDYLPKGVYLGTLNDGSTTLTTAAAQNSSASGPRCIVFDASGHMVIRSYLAETANPDGAGAADYIDWNLTPGTDNTSSPGVVLTIPTANSTAPSASNTEIMVVNSYTGNLIR